MQMKIALLILIVFCILDDGISIVLADDRTSKAISDTNCQLYGNIAGNVYYMEKNKKERFPAVAKVYAVPYELTETNSFDLNGIETDSVWIRLPNLTKVEKQAESDEKGRFLLSKIEVLFPSKRYTIIAAAQNFHFIVFNNVPVYPGASMHLEIEIVFEPDRYLSKFYQACDSKIPMWYGRRPDFEAAPSAPAFQKHEESQGVSYTVFATREGLVGFSTANGHIIEERDHFVALPTREYLCSDDANYDYLVSLTYNGKTVTAPVWDVGPWCIHDNYLAPEPLREVYQYLDHGGQSGGLGQGLPFAQAAFYNNFNDGYREKRWPNQKVLNPAGIDLADGIFWDDLELNDNDWVQVEYLWESFTIVGGYESGAWTLDGSPYIFEEDVIIDQSESLTVESGTSVFFNGHSLEINGIVTFGLMERN